MKSLGHLPPAVMSLAVFAAAMTAAFVSGCDAGPGGHHPAADARLPAPASLATRP